MAERKDAVRANPTKARDFLYFATRYGGDDCLIWPHTRGFDGRGRIRDLNGARKYVYAHRLVCEIAHGPPPTPRHMAAHSCGNGHLGCVNPKHLRWATHLENVADMMAHGTHTDNSGERNGRAKLSKGQAAEIKRLKGKVPQRELAERFRISEQMISAIQTGRRWPELGSLP